MNGIAAAVVMFSVLIPAKTWYAPDQNLTVTVKPAHPVTLVLTDFAGKGVEPKADASVPAEKAVDLKPLFPAIMAPGTYLLYAVPQGARTADFDGTPLVISVRQDKRRNAPQGAMVIKVEPLRYAVLTTAHGPMTLAFYYDAAPHTVANFQTLAEGGFYDGLTFHRVVPDTLIQGGDPRGDGTGGPGYSLDAEFNDRPHEQGVLSMARVPDPLETQPPFPAPRPEYANSAGSQFFICLNYQNTRPLDGKSTAFARVVAGLDTLKALAAVPLEGDAPKTPLLIQKVELKPVTARDNPYADLKVREVPATLPTTAPAP